MIATALELPRLEGIPKTITHKAGGVLDARLLLALDDAGYLEDADWTGRTAVTSAYLLRAVITRWWWRQIEGFKFLSVQLRILSMVGEDFGSTSKPGLAFIVDPNGWDVRFMKGRCLAIERLAPGLAETAIKDLQESMHRTFDCLTPYYALQRCASMAYWYGEADEREALLNMQAEGAQPDDVDLYRREQFFNAVPRWVVEPKRRLTEAKVRRLARGRGIVGEVARELLALRVARRSAEKRYRYHNFEHPITSQVYTIGVAGAMRWSREDDCARLFDDFMHDMFNGGEAEETCLDLAVDAHPEAFIDTMRALEGLLAHAGAVDRLACLLSTGSE